MPQRTLWGIALVGVLLAAGCTAEPDTYPGGQGIAPVTPAAPAPPRQARTSMPADDTVVVPAGAAADLAIAVSRALYDHAPVVVLAGEDDTAGQAAAAPVAVGLGVPLLLTPGGGDAAAAALAEELLRLAPEAVLTFGSAPARWVRDTGGDVPAVPAPADPTTLDALTGVPLGAPQEVTTDELAVAVAALRRDRPARLTVTDAGPADPVAGESGAGESGAGDSGAGDSAAPAGGDGPEGLPSVAAAEPLDSLTVLAVAAPDSVAATATARAGGARVLFVSDHDPRVDRGAIAALTGEPAAHVVALGDGFGPADRLRRRLDTAATGVELPGGGQVVFPGRRMVALYGHPGDSRLGVLGEQGVADTITRAKRTAATYQRLVDGPVVPAFEIITTVASAAAGDDGDYSAETPVEQLRPWVDAARREGVYVVLDLQPGHADFLSQARRYEDLLAQPHVGLALDPEWRLAPGQRHMVQIGSVDATEVNEVAAWLAELTKKRKLPQKLLMLHQFRLDMITGRDRLDTGHDELAVLIHADGFGTPGQKFGTWNALRTDPAADVWWGWKNFYDEDRPTFTPKRTMEIEPAPFFVSYQ